MRYALSRTYWWGGYITDVIKKYDGVDSMKVSQCLKHNPGFEKENVNFFLNEMENFGKICPKIIAIGDAAYEVLKRNLAYRLSILKILHYALRMSKGNYRISLATPCLMKNPLRA